MNSERPIRVLTVGPLPPPLAGTSVSFQIFCDQANQHPDKVRLNVINSAPKHLGQERLLTFGHLSTAMRILCQFGLGLFRTDKALVFANDQFLLALVPFCIAMAKLTRRPCYVRVFGGSLDKYYENLPAVLQTYLRWWLNRADGVIVQTGLLRSYFTEILGQEVQQLPGYRLARPADKRGEATQNAEGSLRLVYLGHVREEKGVFVLLDSLRQLESDGQDTIHCDIYGPVYKDEQQRFDRELARTRNADYRGILRPEDVDTALRKYDALVFPTYYDGEGHSGVLVEALTAGLPVITTNFRSIPEIVQDRKTGMLVPPQDAAALAASMRLLHEDPDLRSRIAETVAEMRGQFDATEAIRKLLIYIGVDFESSEAHEASA